MSDKKTFSVKLEFDKVLTMLLDVEVKASTREKAIRIAIENYKNNMYADSDMYEADDAFVTMNINSSDWIVDEE
jgi:hypothetical protein